MNQLQSAYLSDVLQSIIQNLYQNELDDNSDLDNQALIISQGDFCLKLFDNIKWIHQLPLKLIEQEFDKKYQLAIVVVAADEHQQPLYQQSIQRCRDLFGRHCLVLLPVNHSLNLTAMGFSRLTQQLIEHDSKPYELWQFNLFDYKHLPDWFNSKFWANPENWDKFRW